MSGHGNGVRCPVGSRTLDNRHQLGTNRECGLCMLTIESRELPARWAAMTPEEREADNARRRDERLRELALARD